MYDHDASSLTLKANKIVQNIRECLAPWLTTKDLFASSSAARSLTATRSSAGQTCQGDPDGSTYVDVMFNQCCLGSLPVISVVLCNTIVISGNTQCLCNAKLDPWRCTKSPHHSTKECLESKAIETCRCIGKAYESLHHRQHHAACCCSPNLPASLVFWFWRHWEAALMSWLWSECLYCFTNSASKIIKV